MSNRNPLTRYYNHHLDGNSHKRREAEYRDWETETPRHMAFYISHKIALDFPKFILQNASTNPE